jgi:hypothetical protein
MYISTWVQYSLDTKFPKYEAWGRFNKKGNGLFSPAAVHEFNLFADFSEQLCLQWNSKISLCAALNTATLLMLNRLIALPGLSSFLEMKNVQEYGRNIKEVCLVCPCAISPLPHLLVHKLFNHKLLFIE